MLTPKKISSSLSISGKGPCTHRLGNAFHRLFVLVVKRFQGSTLHFSLCRLQHHVRPAESLCVPRCANRPIETHARFGVRFYPVLFHGYGAATGMSPSITYWQPGETLTVRVASHHITECEFGDHTYDLISTAGHSCTYGACRGESF